MHQRSQLGNRRRMQAEFWFVKNDGGWWFGLQQHRGEGDGIAGEPYTQAQVLEYCEFCDRMIDDAVDALDLDATESGFSWYRMSKLEHQFVNIRHIQHHAAQLIDRVRSAADVGIRWVAAR